MTKLLKKYSARAMLNYSAIDLAKILKGKFILVFDDNQEIMTSSKETIYSSFLWDFHRSFPELALTDRHHIHYLLRYDEKGRVVGGFDGSTHTKLLNNIYWDLHAIRNKDNPHNYDDWLTKETTAMSNRLYNYLSGLDEYIESFDLLDYIEITQIPEVIDYMEKITPDTKGIEGAYDLLSNVIKRDDRLDNNPLVRAARAGSIKNMQLLQVVGPRGKVTDIDSYQFKTPITRGYLAGFKNIYETLVESRPASQSLFFNKDNLQSSEYFSRRLQIQTMVVERIHPGDCGSQHYWSYRLTGEKFDSHGRRTKQNDTHYFKGKYFLNEESNQLQELKETDDQYIGKILKFRSPVAGCSHPDPKGICSTCFGALAASIPNKANLGHICSAYIMNKISQLILSLKHYQGSALIEKIELNSTQNMFFTTNESANVYLLNKSWQGKELKMVVPKNEITGITDLNIVDQANELGSITRFSAITNVSFLYYEDGVLINVPVDISIGRRQGSLTFKFLDYIKQKNWDYDSKGNYVFDMNEWDCNDVLIKLPDIHSSTSDLQKKIETLIESKKSNFDFRNTDTAPFELLEDLHNEINNALDINVALMEIIVYGAMVRDPEHHDFNLPKSGDRKGLGVTEITVNSRSLGGSMAYEGQVSTIQDPNSYFGGGRPSHVLDVFVKPKETVEDFYKPRW